MLDLVRGLKNLVKLSHVQIDSSIFRLHYTITGKKISLGYFHNTDNFVFANKLKMNCAPKLMLGIYSETSSF